MSVAHKRRSLAAAIFSIAAAIVVARWGHRISIHFLPEYAPNTNPIERVWWHLHGEITRNHRCKSIEELVDLAFDWFGYKDTFAIETSIYPQAIAA